MLLIVLIFYPVIEHFPQRSGILICSGSASGNAFGLIPIVIRTNVIQMQVNVCDDLLWNTIFLIAKFFINIMAK